jgi:hypothetical protein
MLVYFKYFKRLGSFFLLLLLTGCASVKITGLSEDRSLKPRQVESINISPYKTITKHSNPKLDTKYLDQNTGFIYVGRLKDNPPVSNKLGIILANSIFRSFKNKNPTISDNSPESGLLITGQMTKEKEGSRALRTLIGLGAGKTKLDTKTFVYNLDKSKKTPWLTIWTSGHSGREPGAIFSAMPSPILAFNILGAIGTAGTIINHGNKGLTQDAKRSGKVIGKELVSKLEF